MPTTAAGRKDERRRDYSLVGKDSRKAVATGLAAAEWYHSEVPRARIKELMRRSDPRALRDHAIWFSAFFAIMAGAIWLFGSWWSLPFFIAYGVLYGASNDSRWHEFGHGTAFRSPWLNELFYQIASFMMVREPTAWRWLHARHHTDTLIVGRDPGIVAHRPPDIAEMVLNLFLIKAMPAMLMGVVRHAFGLLNAEEREYIPQVERHKVVREARGWLVLYGGIVSLAVATHSILPLLLAGPLPSMYGHWWAQIIGITQHAGLQEDVLDHRLNSRTIYMNPLWRFLYLNMNYHLEHHMFPMVPYYNLPKLHEAVKADCPRPYSSTWAAYREIIPTLLRQLKNPEYFARRVLPPTARPFRPEYHVLDNMVQ